MDAFHVHLLSYTLESVILQNQSSRNLGRKKF